MRINWPSGINETSFLQDYWQKRPLLIRQAFNDLPEIISPEELAGMALEPEIESRVISNYQSPMNWQLSTGPFEEAFFSQLPEDHWTLLVQDVDKYIPEAKNFLKQFNFVPSWRVDDLMVSYAVDQGSVGPHTDSYDVFLIQLQGNRLWQISDESYSKDDLLPDSEVKVLCNFKHQHEWLLTPGDMLYLPPDIAHWGVAQGECLTGSVGFLAPSASEIFSAWADHVVQEISDSERFSESDLSNKASPFEISASDISKAEKIIAGLIKENSGSMRRSFGELISQSKSHLEIISGAENYNPEQHPKQGVSYCHHPYLRMFYTVDENNTVLLFANGETLQLDAGEQAYAQYLCENDQIDFDDLQQWMDNEKNKSCFTMLLDSGCLEILEKTDENS
ncbi:MAG: cupin domain-containing protein [Gammaproteobacteria bacterium]|jgi:50S ribosomal protein L16 3-hydroxylase